MSKVSKRQHKYHFSISFSGKDRGIATRLAKALKARKHEVFFDEFEKSSLWGKDLYKHLYDMYFDASFFCVILLSENYFKTVWTNHEFKAAHARAMIEKREYILPIRLDRFEVPAEFKAIGYLSLEETSFDEIVEALGEKFRQALAAEGYIDQNELVNRLNEHFMHSALTNMFMRELEMTEDPVNALRTALLSVIYLANDHVHDAIKGYFNYLVSGFPPLIESFDKGVYRLKTDKGLIARALKEDGRFELLMPENFMINEVNMHNPLMQRSDALSGIEPDYMVVEQPKGRSLASKRSIKRKAAKRSR